MKSTKLVFKGQAQSLPEGQTEPQTALLTLELVPENNEVHVRLLQDDLATDENLQVLQEAWPKGELPSFLAEVPAKVYQLSATEPMFPAFEDLSFEGFEEERQRHEWLLLVLSEKLFQTYRSELDELQDRIEAMDTYDRNIWDELRAFQNKVQEQHKSRNLSNEKNEQLRGQINPLFTRLKELRAEEDSRLQAASSELLDKLNEELGRIETVLYGPNPYLNSVFNDLREVQKSYRAQSLPRSSRNEIWDRIDKAFKFLKEKRAQNQQNAGQADQRLGKRIEGLKEAIARMVQSIERDERDLSFQSRRADSSTANQLEAQLAEVRIKLVKDRVESKNEKLADMRKTLQELEQRLKRSLSRQEKQKPNTETNNQDQEEDLAQAPVGSDDDDDQDESQD